MMARYNSDAAFERALAALWDHWSRLLDGYQVSSGDEKLDRMVNIWNQYQPLTKKGNLAVGSGFNDDPLWLIAGTDAYLRETGDWTILDEPTFGEGKTAGSPARQPGRSPASRRPFSACSPRWTVLPSIPVSPRDGQAIPSSAATAVQSTASLWRILTA